MRWFKNIYLEKFVGLKDFEIISLSPKLTADSALARVIALVR